MEENKTEKQKTTKKTENHTVAMLIKCIHLYFEKELNCLLAEYDLTAAQRDVLGFIKYHEEQEINPIDLEKHFMLSRPTITGILKRLESKDFICFTDSAKDRRYKQISLTEKGISYSVIAEREYLAMTEKLCGGFKEEQLGGIREALEKMLKNLKESEV